MPYRVHGMMQSYFTRKMTGYLDHKGIPWLFRRFPGASPEAMVAGFPGGVPVVQTPAGEFMWDSTAMIHHLELRYPEPAVLPQDPVQRFLCYVIEDAAEGLGSVYHGKRAGSLGLFGTFSFHGSKTMTTGEGGMFVTSDSLLYEKVLMLSNHGRSKNQTKQFWPDVIGYKYKMSNVQAAIGCAQMTRMGELVAGKRRVFKYYERNLEGLPVSMNPEGPGTVNGYWMPTLVFKQGTGVDRERVIGTFRENSIDARVFFWPLSMLPAFNGRPVNNEVSRGIYQRAINLPSYHDISEDDLSRVVKVVRSFF